MVNLATLPTNAPLPLRLKQDDLSLATDAETKATSLGTVLRQLSHQIARDSLDLENATIAKDKATFLEIALSLELRELTGR